MAEYIEKEALMVALCKEITGDGDYYNGKDDMQDQIRDMVSQFPAVDVAPVRHGHWISLTECANEGVYCSICKKKVWKSDYARCSKKSRNKLRSNYCPNCGAKMDLED